MEETTAWIMVAIAAVELGVGINQFLLTRKLEDQTNEKLRKALQQQEEEAKAMKEELEAKATKEELKRAVGQTVWKKVPEVLQEMAQQYASQGAADQQGSSGVDSR